MELFPAIDIRGAKVVRLTKGDYDVMKVYRDSPIEVANELAGKLSPVFPLQLQEKYFDLPSQKPLNRPLWG